LPPFCSQNTEAGLARFASGVGMGCLELHETKKTMPISKKMGRLILQDILLSFFGQVLGRISSELSGF
jgi:hypothetical protein